MANIHFDERVRAARPTPARAYYDMLESTLAGLRDTKRNTNKRWLPLAAGIAVTLIALTLAGPPVARATAAFFERLFAGRSAAIEQELARPADERAQEISDSFSAQEYYLQTYKLTAVKVGEVEAGIVSAGLSRREDGGWCLSTSICYAQDVKGFDPAWFDYTLAINGRDIPMNMDNGTMGYRRDKLVCEGTNLMAPWWRTADGLIESYVSFNVDATTFDKPIDMTVSARLHTRTAGAEKDRDIGLMTLSFTFDRALAEAQELERAQANMPLLNDYLNDEKNRYDALAAEAVPVNACYEAAGGTIRVEEMALMNGRIYFTMTAADKDGYYEHYKAAMLIKDIRVDGMVFSHGSCEDTLEYKEGVISIVHDTAFGRDPRRLPDSSLIYLALDARDDDNAAVVFRYDWASKVATPPADEKEGRAWLDEEAALAKVHNVDPYVDTYFCVGVSQTKGGATVTVDEVNLYGGIIMVRFLCEGRDIAANDYERDYMFTVDGVDARFPMSYDIDSFQFAMPVHMTELSDTLSLTFMIPITFEDGGKETYDFDLSLNIADAEVRNMNDMKKR